MTAKRFMVDDAGTLIDIQTRDMFDIVEEVVDLLNEQYETIEQLKKENNKLHQKIFEMRTNIALERTEISKQIYTGKKNEKEYLTAKEFLDEIEKW